MIIRVVKPDAQKIIQSAEGLGVLVPRLYYESDTVEIDLYKMVEQIEQHYIDEHGTSVNASNVIMHLCQFLMSEVKYDK